MTLNNLKLFPYQIEGIKLIKERKNVLLADHPGAGKTCQAILAAESLGAESVLVICPASLKENWKREFRKWSSKEFSLIVMSYEAAGQLKTPAIGLECFFEVDVLILDEAHYLKNPKSQRTFACLDFYWRNARHHIAITGTPLPNGRAIEAWPLFAKLDEKNFGDKRKFINTYCVRQQTPWGVNYNGSKNLEQLGRIAKESFMIRRKRSETIGQLPPLVRQTVPIEPQFHHGGLSYDDVNKYNGCDTEDLTPEIKSIWRRHALSKIFSSTEYIKNLLKEVECCVVFAHHMDVLSGLKEKLDANCVTNCMLRGDTDVSERQKIVDEFQDGKYKVFLASLHAASTGITLTKAQDVIFVECDFVPSINEQAEGRVFRITQKSVTRSHYLIIENSLDERITSAVLKKQQNINKVMGIN